MDSNSLTFQEELKKQLTLGIPTAQGIATTKAHRLHATIKGMVTKAHRKPELASLLRYRHNYLSHTSNNRKKLNKTPNIRPAKWGDEEIVLKFTIPIVHRLSLLILETDQGFEELEEIWLKNSKEFWARIN